MSHGRSRSGRQRATPQRHPLPILIGVPDVRCHRGCPSRSAAEQLRSASSDSSGFAPAIHRHRSVEPGTPDRVRFLLRGSPPCVLRSARTSPWSRRSTIRGMIEASATRRFCTPFTRSCGSTTAAESRPMRQVPTSWKYVVAPLRTNSTSSAADSVRPGITSRLANGRIAAELPSSRHSSMPSARAATSSGCDRNAASRIGLSVRISGLQLQPAPALRCDQARAQRPAARRRVVLLGQHLAGIRDLDLHDVDVRRREAAVGLPEAGRVGRAVARRLGLVGLPQTAAVQDVVLEVRPHLRRVHDHLDAVAAQIRGVADTAEHQDLRGVDTARAQDDLARGPDDDVLARRRSPRRRSPGRRCSTTLFTCAWVSTVMFCCASTG